VLILGVAYRGDVREHAFSSARLLQSALQARGARIWAVDPLFEDRELAAMGYTPFSSEWSGEVQAIILQADHQAFRSFDVSRYPNCRVVLDGRWAMSPKQIRQIKVLGMEYLRIGSGQGAAVSARERGAR
jgi:UDP-N-acetyl-D-mannosaminuronate dehydrogenase